MIGWFVWGAMYLARSIKYAVQAGWSLIVSFIRLLPLTGLGAAESGVDCRIFSIIAVNATLVLIAMRPAIAVFGI